jgi:hypothetical protein
MYTLQECIYCTSFPKEHRLQNLIELKHVSCYPTELAIVEHETSYSLHFFFLRLEHHEVKSFLFRRRKVLPKYVQEVQMAADHSGRIELYLVEALIVLLFPEKIKTCKFIKNIQSLQFGQSIG